jgi:phage N-6-adenine-methyltransferase
VISPTLYSSEKMDWRTPPEVFSHFHAQHAFDFDAAATAKNALLPQFIPPEVDSLSVSWKDLFPEATSVWLNPPYGRGIGRWTGKCVEESRKGLTVGALIFARTDTRWWHDHVMSFADSVCLIKGRIRFLKEDGTAGNAAPAPSAFIVWTDRPNFRGPTFTTWERP